MKGNEDVLIVITSDEPWGNVMHTQLHYAFQLSKYFEVIYINPPRVWSPSSGFIDYKKTYRVNARLLVIPYRHLFPLRFLSRLFTFFNDVLTSFTIRKYIPEGKSKTILWRFDHFRFFTAWLPGKQFRIYHVVDNYVGKPGDKEFSVESDMVVVTSPRLLEHYYSLNKNVLHIPQCIPEEDSLVDESIVAGHRLRYGKFILFIGTFSSEVDMDLLDRLAKKLPDSNILVIGPVLSLSADNLQKLCKVQANSNIHFIGSIPGLELKNYTKAAEVCIVPYKFREERSVHIRSPLKILNYISQKRPVVTTMESEITDAESMGIHFVANADEFLEKTESLLKKPAEVNSSKIDEYLKSVSYPYRLNEIFGKINEISVQENLLSDD